MSQDLFTKLPSSIIIDILSRLPVRTVPRCKCVCKSWLGFLEDREFSKRHLSRSASGLAVYQMHEFSDSYEVYEFEDDGDLQHHDQHYSLLTSFKLPSPGYLQGSANGLLLLRNLRLKPNGLFVCNPITREYAEILCPREFDYSYPQVVTFGFGASKSRFQHKVVRIFHDCAHDQETNKREATNSECQVYTLGTGSWRRVEPSAPLIYSCRSIGAFLNGNLHWLVFDSDGEPKISCFDLETERFTIISAPPPLRHQRILADVFALGDFLCVCDNASEDVIDVWLMKEYGIEKSWTKEFVIKKPVVETSYEVVCPFKVFKDGDILMGWEHFFLFYSSGKTRTIMEIERFEAWSFGAIEAILHKPSFLSLKSIGMENVCSF